MLLAILQNDPSLLPCRLAALRPQVDFADRQTPDAIGAGYVQNGQVLVRHRPGSVPGLAADPLSLVADVRASAVVVHTRRATVGSFKDENTHPFRKGGWLFAHDGTVAHFGDLRPALLERLPPFIRRGVTGETDSAHVFALFLAELKALGALSVREVPGEILGEALRRTVRAIEALSASVGDEPSTLNLVALDGRHLVACRRGTRPLHYALLDGMAECARHDLGADAPETHPQRLPHRHLRSVAVASALTGAADAAWAELADGQVLTAGPDFQARLIPIDA